MRFLGSSTSSKYNVSVVHCKRHSPCILKLRFGRRYTLKTSWAADSDAQLRRSIPTGAVRGRESGRQVLWSAPCQLNISASESRATSMAGSSLNTMARALRLTLEGRIVMARTFCRSMTLRMLSVNCDVLSSRKESNRRGPLLEDFLRIRYRVFQIGSVLRLSLTGPCFTMSVKFIDMARKSTLSNASQRVFVF